MFGNIGDAEPT
jgi:zinc finger protein